MAFLVLPVYPWHCDDDPLNQDHDASVVILGQCPASKSALFDYLLTLIRSPVDLPKHPLMQSLIDLIPILNAPAGAVQYGFDLKHLGIDDDTRATALEQLFLIENAQIKQLNDRQDDQEWDLAKHGAPVESTGEIYLDLLSEIMASPDLAPVANWLTSNFSVSQLARLIDRLVEKRRDPRKRVEEFLVKLHKEQKQGDSEYEANIRKIAGVGQFTPEMLAELQSRQNDESKP